jgi:pyrroline-5-carboxylate reductase
MTQLDLAILGGGNMGRALVGGLLRQGLRTERITVGESGREARERLSREFGVAATADNAEAVRRAKIVVIAVKPQDVETVLTPLRTQFEQSHPVCLSIAAGIRTRALRRWCAAQVPVVRAMPNRPALVGAGITGLFAGAEVDAAHYALAEEVMQSVGEVVRVDTEDALDVVTAVSGSGPAYFFRLAELMAQSGADLGLAPEAARRLAIATLHGAGLLAHTGGDLARLREEVTSRGGTTEAALRTLEAAGIGEIVSRAIEAATRRSRELAEQFGPT